MAQRSGLDRKVDYGLLNSFYGALLTERQRSMLSLYCDEDYAISEVARHMQVTKQCVNDTLSRAFERLDYLEDSLQLIERMTRLQEGMTQVGQLIQQVLDKPGEQNAPLQQALTLTETLLRQEEE